MPAVAALFMIKPPVSGFTPASLPGLVAWYDASVGVFKDAGTTPAANTDSVQQWNDQSGHNYHMSQATSGSRPQFQSTGFNGRQTVKFTAGFSTYMSTVANAVTTIHTSTHSWFAVGQMLTSTGSYGRLISYVQAGGTTNDYDELGSQLLVRDGSTNAFCTYSAGTVASDAISLATNYRFGQIYDGVNLTPYVNNVAGTPVAFVRSLGASGTINVGTSYQSGGYTAAAWDGPISEIVVTASSLGSTDRTSLDNYFRTKWGL